MSRRGNSWRVGLDQLGPTENSASIFSAIDPLRRMLRQANLGRRRSISSRCKESTTKRNVTVTLPQINFN